MPLKYFNAYKKLWKPAVPTVNTNIPKSNVSRHETNKSHYRQNSTDCQSLSIS